MVYRRSAGKQKDYLLMFIEKIRRPKFIWKAKSQLSGER